MSDGSTNINQLFTPEEQQRYSRHLLLEEIGSTGQQRLRKSRIIVIGAGGLGCPALQYLVAAGIGQIGIVEDDEVNLSNLQRQILYRTEDIGQPKGRLARDHLLAMNPHCTIDLFQVRLDAGNAEGLIAPYDIVLDCTDNFHTRYLLNDCCILLHKPLVQASVHRFKGSITLFNTHGGGPCYRCLFPEQPQEGMYGTCQSEGVLGVLPGIIGSIQAAEAIKHILAVGTSLQGRYVDFDILTMCFKEFIYHKDPDCPSCSRGAALGLQRTAAGTTCQSKAADAKKYEITPASLLELPKESYQLVDMRSLQQRAAHSLAGSLSCTEAALADMLALLPPHKAIILYCHEGTKSLRAAKQLAPQLGREILSLKGGIAFWPYGESW